MAASDAASRRWHQQSGVPLFAWASQANGFFSGRFSPDDRSDAAMVRFWYSDDNFKRLDRARELARKKGVSALQIALAYVLCQPFETYALIGPRTISETATSAEALAVELSEEEIKWLAL